jgi:beta-phosphoglucomutase
MAATRAVVFDFDGVIVDSEPAHARAIKAALSRMGMAFPYEHDYGRFIGRGDRECFVEVAREQGRELSAADLQLLVAFKGAAFVQALRDGLIRPFGATLELVRAAAERGPVAVCSGSLRESVEPVLEHFGIAACMTTVVTASDVDRNKPDPAPYLLAASRLGMEPGRCVAVEDSPTGIRAARGAGYVVHGVCHSFPRDRLSEADHVHESTAAIQLEALLG